MLSRMLLSSVCLLPCVAGCDDALTSPSRDAASVSRRLPPGSEAVVRPFGGAEETHLKGLVEDATAAFSPRGRDAIKSGTHVIVLDDSLADLHNNIPGSRDVAVKLKNGGAEGKAVFIARTDLQAAQPSRKGKGSNRAP